MLRSAVSSPTRALTPIAIQPSGLDAFNTLNAVLIVFAVVTAEFPKSVIFLTANAAAMAAAIGFACSTISSRCFDT